MAPSKLRRPRGPFTFIVGVIALQIISTNTNRPRPSDHKGLKSLTVRSRADRCPLLSSLQFPGIFPCLLIPVQSPGVPRILFYCKSEATRRVNRNQAIRIPSSISRSTGKIRGSRVANGEPSEYTVSSSAPFRTPRKGPILDPCSQIRIACRHILIS